MRNGLIFLVIMLAAALTSNAQALGLGAPDDAKNVYERLATRFAADQDRGERLDLSAPAARQDVGNHGLPSYRRRTPNELRDNPGSIRQIQLLHW